MKTKIFLLAVSIVLIQGKSLDTSQLRRQLLETKMLSWSGEDDSSSKEAPPGPNDGKIDEIQKILGMLSEALEAFKGRNDDWRDESLQKEIDKVASRISEVEEKLTILTSESRIRLELSVWIFASRLSELYGPQLDKAFWDKYSASELARITKYGKRTEQTLGETSTGNDFELQSPAQQLKMLANLVEEVKNTVDKIIDDGAYASFLIRTLLYALNNVTSGDVTTTESTTEDVTTTESTTSFHEDTTPVTPMPVKRTNRLLTHAKRTKPLLRSRLVNLLKREKYGRK